MAGTIFREAVVAITKAIAPTLSEAGFKRSGLSFRRETEPGLVQFINFQLSSGNVGDLSHGRFYVNLGVYVAEVGEHEFGELAKPSELRSLIRERVDPPNGDYWQLGRTPDRIAADLLDRLSSDTFPWLDQRRTREQLVKGLMHSEGFLPPMQVVGVAAILLHQGNETQARQLLQRGIDEADKPRFADIIRREAKLLGLA